MSYRDVIVIQRASQRLEFEEFPTIHNLILKVTQMKLHILECYDK